MKAAVVNGLADNVAHFYDLPMFHHKLYLFLKEKKIPGVALQP